MGGGVLSDIVLTVDGMDYTDFEDLVIEESVSGAGLSGIVKTQLSVTIHEPYFHASDNAPVSFHMTGVTDYPSQFFISKREISGNIVKLTCRSKLYRLDTTADFNENDFDENDEIEIHAALAKIAGCAGLEGYASMGGDIEDALPKLHKDFLFKANCMSLVEKISAALCGTFREHQNRLTFCPWETAFMQNCPAVPLNPITLGLKKQIKRVIMSGGGKTFNVGYGGYTNTVRINTPLASSSLVNYVHSRLFEKEYQPYECKSAMLSSFPLVGCTINFGDSNDSENLYFTNNVKIYPRRSGLFCRLACNAVNEDEWDYNGEIERRVMEKIAAGERFGSTTFLPDGKLRFESEERIGDTDAGYSSELAIDDTDGFVIRGQKAKVEATESVKLTGERMDIETPLINLPPAELLTESKDLIGALNELFTAGSGGGDFGILDLMQYDELWQAVVQAHHAHQSGITGYAYVLGSHFANPIDYFSCYYGYGVRVFPKRSASMETQTFLFDVKFHIYAGMNSVSHIKSGHLTFIGGPQTSHISTKITSIMSGEDSLGNAINNIDTQFDSPVNIIVIVYENSTITTTGYYGGDPATLETVWAVPPGFDGFGSIGAKRLACIYPETPSASPEVSNGLLMSDILNGSDNGMVGYSCPFDIFGCGRETYPNMDHYPLFSCRNIQYMIDKKNGIQHPTLFY